MGGTAGVRMVSGAVLAVLMQLAGAAGNPALAQASGAVTLEDAVRRAVTWHPSVDEAVSRLNQQAEQINIARSGYFPNVTGGVSLDYDSGPAAWQPTLNLSATQMIFDFGKVASSIEVATAGTEVSRAQLLLAVDQLIRDTAYAVIETQRYQALRSAAEQQRADIAAIGQLVQQRTDSGASTMSDVVQAKVRVQAAETMILQIDAELRRWSANLMSLTGLHDVSVTASVPAWLGGSCDIGEPVWSQVPAIMQAEAQHQQALAQVDQSRAQALPTLSLEAGAGVDLGQFSIDKPDFTVGLNFSGKIFEGGAGAARQSAAGYASQAAGAALESARLQVALAIGAARDQTASLVALQDSMAERDALLQLTRDLYQKQYLELGTRTLLDLLNADQDLHQGRFEAINTAHDVRRLAIDCLFNSGVSRQAFALDDLVVRGVALAR